MVLSIKKIILTNLVPGQTNLKFPLCLFLSPFDFPNLLAVSPISLFSIQLFTQSLCLPLYFPVFPSPTFVHTFPPPAIPTSRPPSLSLSSYRAPLCHWSLWRHVFYNTHGSKLTNRPWYHGSNGPHGSKTTHWSQLACFTTTKSVLSAYNPAMEFFFLFSNPTIKRKIFPLGFQTRSER